MNLPPPPVDELRSAGWIAGLPLAAWQKDLQLRYTGVSRSWCRQLGLSGQQAMLGLTDSSFFPPWVAQNLLRADLAALAGREAGSCDVTLYLKNGERREVRSYRQLLLDAEGCPAGLQGFMLDVTREKQLAAELKTQGQRQNTWLKALQDHALITTMDRQGRFTYLSASLCRLVGQLPDMLLGQRRPVAWLPQELDLRYYLALAEQGTPVSFEFACPHPHGHTVYLRSLIIALNRASEQEQVFFEMLTDLSNEKAVSAALGTANEQLMRVLQDNTELIAQLEVTARTDPLTGLLNRRAFFERATQEQDRSSRHGAPIALIMLDIDHFKLINDRYGHDAGDLALKGLAELLREQLRSIDVLARLGGEEFAILLPDTDQVGAVRIAERVRQAVSQQRYRYNGDTVFHFTVSQGVAMRLPDESVSETLTRADHGLYEAKQTGRNRVCLGRSSMLPE